MKSYCAVAVAACLLALSATSIADEPQDLPGYNIIFVPCAYVYACVYMSPISSSLMFTAPPNPYPPIVSGVSEDFEVLVATCESLQDRANQIGCDVNNPPPAPYYPSPTLGQYQPNGCGIGNWFDEIGAHIVGLDVEGYTGDLDNPLPGVSFRAACDGHDACYHTGFKHRCDNTFAQELSRICSTASAATGCVMIAGRYTTAVDDFGQFAHTSDQLVMECAKIAKDLNDGNCV